MIKHGTGFILCLMLLYTGPIFAGWGGAPWQAMPVFALLFLLWVSLFKPANSIGPTTEWTNPGLWLRLGGAYLVHVALVSLLWVLGGWLALIVPSTEIPVLWPLAMSALSVPLTHFTYRPLDPETEAAAEAFLDQAVTDMENAAKDAEESQKTERPKAHPSQTKDRNGS
jgi:hypothetical protein